jgi:DNA (cytosine-5)-methyltransferase 1
MTISYDRLWKLLIDHKITRTQLRKVAGLSSNVVARMGKQEPVSMESLMRICQALHCNIGDIVEVSDEQIDDISTNIQNGGLGNG